MGERQHLRLPAGRGRAATVNGHPGATRGGGREVEVAVAAMLAVMLGPFTLIAGLVLAVVGQSWRRLWLAVAALPGPGSRSS